jgi:acyl carrier protein
MITKADFLKILHEEVLSECENELTFESNFKELECWDSITALTLIALFDSEFEFKLTGDSLRNCNNILDLFELIENK